MRQGLTLLFLGGLLFTACSDSDANGGGISNAEDGADSGMPPEAAGGSGSTGGGGGGSSPESTSASVDVTAALPRRGSGPSGLLVRSV